VRAIEAETFSGYGGLRQTELPKPQPAKDRVLVRVTAAASDHLNDRQYHASGSRRCRLAIWPGT
jgi:NADPH:quinone reductase